jgi:hypothetical protein
MRMVRRYGWILIIITWGLGMGSSRRLAAQEVSLPQPVKDALARYVELKTLSVRWSQQFQASKSAHGKLDPGKLKFFLIPREDYMIWQDGKIYSQVNIGGREWKDAPNSDRRESAFDGKVMYHGTPSQVADDGKSRSPGLVKSVVANKDPNANYFSNDYFEAIGIRLPQGAELLQVKHLVSQLLFLLEHGGQLKAVGPAQIDNRSVTRVAVLADNPRWPLVQKVDLAAFERELRGGPNTEAQIQKMLAAERRAKEVEPRKLEYVFYLDPKFGYAVSRWQELTESGRLQLQSDCTNHEKLPGHEIWLARTCRIDYYTFVDVPGEFFDPPLLSMVVEVSDFGTKPVPDEQFTLTYTVPGTHITDDTLGKGPVSYTVPANPQDLDRAITAAQSRQQANAQERKREVSWKIVLLAVNTVVLVGLLVFLVIRYRRRKAARS